ncbi:hypothetical protein SARC_14640, partial [Sphaeroforma arctica JP610]
MMAYADRKEWEDVVPIEQDDGPNPPCAISYSKAYVDAMNYFRAVMHTCEKSQRAFDLTTGGCQCFGLAFHMKRMKRIFAIDVVS